MVRWFLLVTAVSMPALAVKPGDPLVLVEATKLLKDAKASAPAVTPLSRGQEVLWRGASPKDARYHEVETRAGKRGFVLLTSLTTFRPRPEPTSDFVAPKREVPPDDPLTFLEALNRDQATPEAVEAHRRALAK